MLHTLERAEKLAKSLYREYKKGGKEPYNDYLIECMKDCFWGLVVEEHLPIFDKTWELLRKRGYRRENPFVYGDADVGVWVEYPKDKDKKVIVSTRYCSMADDNTHIFILNRIMPDIIIGSLTFRVATVWPRQISKKGVYNDDRDIRTPSIQTYRDRDYEFGYGDGRDKGHAIKYEKMFCKGAGRVDCAHRNEGAIPNALETLRWHLEALLE